MAKKKLNHHLYQDNVSGVWYFQKKIKGFDKPYKFSLETTSVTEARRKRDEYLKEIEYHGYLPTAQAENPGASDTGKVFGEVAQKWAGIVQTQVEEPTYELYQRLMNVYVLPHFGNQRIDTISSLDIEIFVSKLKGGSKFKMNVLTPFRSVMKFAKKHKIILQNPFDDVSPIKRTKGKEKNSLSLNEINQFIDALDDFWKPLFIVLFFSGVRMEEASALKWKRVRFEEGIIQIREVLVRLKGGKIVIKKPKTESSIRDVKLPGFIIDALREQRKRTWKGDGDDFVFLNRAGRPMYHHTLNQKVFKPTLKKIGIDRSISLKDTRASYITNAMDKNERMSFIQKQVGHTTSDMIVRHYYRYTPAHDDGSRLENAWNSTRVLPDQDPSYF